MKHPMYSQLLEKPEEATPRVRASKYVHACGCILFMEVAWALIWAFIALCPGSPRLPKVCPPGAHDGGRVPSRFSPLCFTADHVIVEAYEVPFSVEYQMEWEMENHQRRMLALFAVEFALGVGVLATGVLAVMAWWGWPLDT